MDIRQDILNGLPADVVEVLSETQVDSLVGAIQTMLASVAESRRLFDFTMQNTAATLKATRKQAGLTQKQMSEQLGIPKRTIEDWEAGRRTPPKYVHQAIMLMLLEIAADAHDTGHTD